MRYEIRELGLGGILDQAIALVKDHFGLLFGITAVLYVPFQIIQAGITLANMPQVAANASLAERIAAAQAAQAASLMYMLPLLAVLFLLVIPVTNAAVINAIGNVYLGRPTSVGESLQRGLGALLPLIGTGFLLYLAVLGGILLCVIPGIVAAFWFSLAFHVVVLEHTSGVAALKRSKFLMRGNIGTVFALSLVVGLIAGGLGFAGSFIPNLYAQQAMMIVINTAAMLFSSAAYVVFYFSCRCKAENFDLVILTENLEAEAAPA